MDLFEFPFQPAAFLCLLLPLLVLWRFLYQSFDPREPPVVQPRVPFVGHIISVVREYSAYYFRLHKAKPLPICTLPMLNGKLYVVTSPSLVAAAIRSKDISFDPILVDFVSAVGLTTRQIKVFNIPGIPDRVSQVIHASLGAVGLSKMVTFALADVASHLNELPKGKEATIPDIYPWLRLLMSNATLKALFGEKNPVDREGLEDLWNFEKYFGPQLLGFAPWLIAPKGYHSRKRLQARLGEYFAAGFAESDDVSDLIKNRAALQRNLGFTDDEIGISEFVLAWGATANTNPALMWLFTSVFSRPAYVSRIRSEVAAVTTVTDKPAEGRTGTIDTARLDKSCPFLLACYRESLRLFNDNMGSRRVIADTLLRDPDTGREYLLKKGVTLQWAAGITHLDESTWGADAGVYNPDRWLSVPAYDEKRRRLSYVPFGGGRNLCPGRMLAQTQILSVISVFAMGFEIEGATVPKMLRPRLGSAMRSASWEGIDTSVQIRRREGWEDIEWGFKC